MIGYLIGIGSFAVTFVFLLIYINKLCKTRFFSREQNIQSNKKACIQELHKHKAATPTMGGLAVLIAVFFMALVYYAVNGTVLWLSIMALLFGIMGFVDDYIKIKRVRDGVTRKQKLIGLTLISVALTVYLTMTNNGYYLAVPFMDNFIELNIIVYAALSAFLIVASTNSVNLTDGLDGLAVGVCLIVFAFIGFFAYYIGDDSVFYGAAMFGGACMAFLLFNKHPAKVFMGDTGSLLLGGAIAVFLIKLGLHFWIVLMLPVCIFETLSVIIQLTSIKLFDRRVFKIAPFHHHLEKCGWHETRIVFVFWLITFAACGVSYLAGLHIWH